MRRRTKSAGHTERAGPALRETRMLDSEVVDTLFQFDSMVSDMERDMITDLAPSPMPQSSPAIGRKISPSGSSLHLLEQPSPSSELSSSLDSDICRDTSGISGGMKPYPSPPRSRALPNVNQLKQQFLTPQRPLSAPLHREGKPDLVKGNVKNIIAQMQTSSSDVEQPRSLTPPFVGDQVKKRHSVVIQSKISEFNHQWNEKNDDKKERRKSQSYTPPSVRRKIQSPFLLDEFRFKPDDGKIVTVTRTKEGFTVETDVVIPVESKGEEVDVEREEGMILSPTRTKDEVRVEEKEVSRLPRSEDKEEASVETEEGEILSPNKTKDQLPARTEEEFKMKPEVVSPSSVREQSPVTEEIVTRLRERSPLKEDLRTEIREKSPVNEELLAARLKEKTPVSEELASLTRDRSPMKEEVPLRTREKSPIIDGLANRRKEKSPTPVVEYETEPQYLGRRDEDKVSDDGVSRTSPERTNGIDEIETKILGGEQDDAVRLPPSETEDSQAHEVTSMTSIDTEKSNEDSHLVSFIVLSPPHRKSTKKKKKAKVELPELPLPGEVATPEDVELMFEENTTSTSTLESYKNDPTRKDSLFLESPHRVEVVIGMKENGIFTPPKIVEDDDKPLANLSARSQYDHLSARSQYDHLAPLEPGEDPHKPFQRHRSASDVATHQIRPLTNYSLHEERASSEVSAWVSYLCNINVLEQRREEFKDFMCKIL